MKRRAPTRLGESPVVHISSEPISVFRPGIAMTVFRVVWIVLVVAATSLPYLLNWFSTPSGSRYTWILPPYYEDSFGYMAWAQQAAHGAWLFKIKYTAIPHHAFLFHPFFLVCGWLSLLFSGDIGFVFWIVKGFGVVLFLVTFHRYIDYLGLRPLASVAASVLLCVSGGCGALLVFLNGLPKGAVPPVDLRMPEMTTFWSLLWNPLFPVSLTLILLAMNWLDRGTREGRNGPLWRSGLATGALALIHPYSAPLLIALAAIIIIARRREQAAGMLVRYLAMALPAMIYLALITKMHPLAAKHGVLGEMASPSLSAYVLGFGLPLLFSIMGLALEGRKLLKPYWQIILWFGLALSFAYLPIWFQRKLIFGAHVPLSILAGLAVNAIWVEYSTSHLRRWALIAGAITLLPLMAATPMYLLATQRKKAANNEDGAYYVSNDLMESFQFLKKNTAPDQVVCSGYTTTSTLIPAFAGNTVVWGHWAMAIDLKERRDWASNIFFADSTWDDNRIYREFWSDDIQFLLVDHEINQWLENRPFRKQLLLRNARKIFERSSVVIYERPKTSMPGAELNPN